MTEALAGATTIVLLVIGLAAFVVVAAVVLGFGVVFMARLLKHQPPPQFHEVPRHLKGIVDPFASWNHHVRNLKRRKAIERGEDPDEVAP